MADVRPPILLNSIDCIRRRCRRRGPRSMDALLRRSFRKSTTECNDVEAPPEINVRRGCRRGHRSQEATSRRSDRGVSTLDGIIKPRGGDLCESKSIPLSINCTFTLFHTNIRGYRSIERSGIASQIITDGTAPINYMFN